MKPRRDCLKNPATKNEAICATAYWIGRTANAESALAALKKDARLVAQAGVRAAHHEVLNPEEWEAACRILDATEEGK